MPFLKMLKNSYLFDIYVIFDKFYYYESYRLELSLELHKLFIFFINTLLLNYINYFLLYNYSLFDFLVYLYIFKYEILNITDNNYDETCLWKIIGR